MLKVYGHLGYTGKQRSKREKIARRIQGGGEIQELSNTHRVTEKELKNIHGLW